MLKIKAVIYGALGKRRATIPVALDISAAFDTINNDILIHRLRYTFGLSGCCLDWLASYLD